MLNSKQSILMSKIKHEVQTLFASSRIQSIFDETFKTETNASDNIFSQNHSQKTKSVSETFTRPNFTIRKRSMDFKEKGLIVPATNLTFTQAPPQNPVFGPINQAQSPSSFVNPAMGPQNLFGYVQPMRIIPMMPQLRVFPQNESIKFPNLGSMNIVNNFTNIQNFSNQRENKNVHIFKNECSKSKKEEENNNEESTKLENNIVKSSLSESNKKTEGIILNIF